MYSVPSWFTREAAATLLRFAKATSDPKVAAALIEKAADLNERGEDLSPFQEGRGHCPAGCADGTMRTLRLPWRQHAMPLMRGARALG